MKTDKGWPKKLDEGRQQGFEGPCKACADKAMDSDDPSVRGMASFYLNTTLKRKQSGIFQSDRPRATTKEELSKEIQDVQNAIRRMGRPTTFYDKAYLAETLRELESLVADLKALEEGKKEAEITTHLDRAASDISMKTIPPKWTKAPSIPGRKSGPLKEQRPVFKKIKPHTYIDINDPEKFEYDSDDLQWKCPKCTHWNEPGDSCECGQEAPNITFEKPITARLDRIASELEKIDPRIALAIDKVSGQIGFELTAKIEKLNSEIDDFRDSENEASLGGSWSAGADKEYRKMMGDLDDLAKELIKVSGNIALETLIKKIEKDSGNPADNFSDSTRRVTASLDRLASELEKIDPRIALAIDKVSDRLAGTPLDTYIERIGQHSDSITEKDNFIPPKAVADAAALGLKHRQMAGGKGGLSQSQAAKEGIGSGVQRAVNLKNRDNLSVETIKRMKAFFDRHRKNRSIDPKYKNEPWKDRGWVAWLLWGGDPGDKWSHETVKNLNERMSKKVASNFLKFNKATTLGE